MPYEVYAIKGERLSHQEEEFPAGRSPEDVAEALWAAYHGAEAKGGEIVDKVVLSSGDENSPSTLYLIARFPAKES